MYKSRYSLALIGALVALASARSAQAQAAYPASSSRGTRISGTYELDRRSSDDPRTLVNTATRALPAARRERIAENWIARLDAPQTIAIDINGRTVNLISSNAPQLAFDADGQNHVETAANGRQITTNAAMRGNRLVVSTSGNRGSDFTVTFEAVAGGLLVTRRLDSEMQQTAVSARAMYRRVGAPRWDIFAGSANAGSANAGSGYGGSGYGGSGYGGSGYGRGRGGVSSAVVLPSGTRLVAHLDSALNADEVRVGQRITLTVKNPGPYLNAAIDGTVTRAGSNMGIDFDNIRLMNGRSGTFDAVIEGVTLPDGKAIRVDNSGVAAEKNRSTSGTVEKGAIGAGIGAILGAIIGGGKGAAIGAVAGGAGMILMDTKTDQKLPAGTAFTLSTQ